jgi:hypothetical protein
VARPTTLLKTLSLLLAALLTIAIGFGIWVRGLRDRGWAALEARVAELTPGPDTPPLVRVPLGRTLVPGNAWDDYFRMRSGPILKSLRAFSAMALDGLTAQEKESLIRASTAPIELLRRAVRRETARAPAPDKPPGKNPILGVTGLPIVELTSLCVARARMLAESGNPREALDLLLDVYLCGRDFAGTRRMNVGQWGLRPMETSLRGIQELSGALDPPMLRDLERQLSLLDEYFPDTSGQMLDHLLHLGELLIQEDEDDVTLLQLAPERARKHWRYLYSTRLEAASSFAVADEMTRQVLAQKDLSWVAAEPTIWALKHRLTALDDPVLLFFLEPDQETFRSRNVRTYLRMIRVAVHYRATGEVQTIENDQGGPIRTTRAEEVLQIRNERPPKPHGPDPEPQTFYAEPFLIEVPLRK